MWVAGDGGNRFVKTIIFIPLQHCGRSIAWVPQGGAAGNIRAEAAAHTTDTCILGYATALTETVARKGTKQKAFFSTDSKHGPPTFTWLGQLCPDQLNTSQYEACQRVRSVPSQNVWRSISPTGSISIPQSFAKHCDWLVPRFVIPPAAQAPRPPLGLSNPKGFFPLAVSTEKYQPSCQVKLSALVDLTKQTSPTTTTTTTN